MPRPVDDRLASAGPPWIHLWVGGDPALAGLLAPPSESSYGGSTAAVAARNARCSTRRRACSTSRALRPDVGRAGGLPHGPHVAAGSGYRLVITAADRLLARNPAHYATFVALLEDVGARGLPARPVIRARPCPSTRSWSSRRIASTLGPTGARPPRG